MTTLATVRERIRTEGLRAVVACALRRGLRGWVWTVASLLVMAWLAFGIGAEGYLERWIGALGKANLALVLGYWASRNLGEARLSEQRDRVELGELSPVVYAAAMVSRALIMGAVVVGVCLAV